MLIPLFELSAMKDKGKGVAYDLGEEESSDEWSETESSDDSLEGIHFDDSEEDRVVELDDGFDADVNEEAALLTIGDANGNELRRKKLPPVGLKILQPVADLLGDREWPWTPQNSSSATDSSGSGRNDNSSADGGDSCSGVVV
ncbi:hypothetical protein L195_g011382 [Trifolium pratense]|uniref:Uncharacterized protein n=1 Tax=Trifolium pratense TaxID=57577 RepID=A0A2K3PHD4_TRIPR|nr:hypothetical protein L195_g011382 [Trifolium pratense]